MTNQSPFKAALDARTDLTPYGSNALLLFALELRFGLEDLQTVASTSLTDGPDDKKCDLVYVDVEAGVAVVAQSYVSADTTKVEAKSQKAADLNTAAAWLLTRPIDELPERLRAAATELRSALEAGSISSLQFWYVHNLPGSQNVRDELRTVELTARAALDQRFPDSGVSDVSAIEVGREVLEEWYRSLTIPILVTQKVEVPVPGGFTVANADWEAFVTAVPAAWLYDLYHTHGAELFSANVRGYIGSRNVEANINNGIKKTAGDDPPHFWVYNNGLTVLVNGFYFDTVRNTLELDGLSIVNGAQTTGALGSLKERPSTDALVAARFVKCSRNETIKNIIKYNNSQNRVEAPDFRSNDAIQRRLVQEFEAIPAATYLGGRRGGAEDVIKRPPNLLPSDTVGQVLAAFHSDPVVAYNEKSRIWVSDSLYSRFFSDRTTAKHIVFAYSLLRAIEAKKRQLIADQTAGKLTTAGDRQLNYLRYRGSTFLLVSAISSSLETFLGRAVPDRFRLSFGSHVSPEHGQTIWAPIVEATIPFCDLLLPAVEKGVKSYESTNASLKAFQNMVEATKTANAALFAIFAADVRHD